MFSHICIYFSSHGFFLNDSYVFFYTKGTFAFVFTFKTKQRAKPPNERAQLYLEVFALSYFDSSLSSMLKTCFNMFLCLPCESKHSKLQHGS